MLSGGGAYIPGLPEFLEKRMETSVRLSDPLATIEYDPQLFGSIDPHKIAALLTVAVGLATRKVSA